MATKNALETRIKNLEENEAFLKDIIASQNKLLKSFIVDEDDRIPDKPIKTTKKEIPINMKRRGTLA